MKLKLLLREALRLHRAQPLRTAIVGGIIIVGTMLGTAEPGAGFLVVMLVVLILTVARQSPRPERLAAEAAWRRTGATRMTIRNIGVMESMTLTLAATLIGALQRHQFQVAHLSEQLFWLTVQPQPAQMAGHVVGHAPRKARADICHAQHVHQKVG